MRMLRQPAVIGEILAGILLGPSLLSGLFPSVEQIMIPQSASQWALLEFASLLGAMFLMAITGLELDLPLIRRHARTALGVSFGGVAVTFACGYLVGEHLPDHFLADPERRHVFSMFLATAMSISAVPVPARVLFELKLMRRDIGQTMIAAGMSDDTIGWTLLSVAVAMSSVDVVSPYLAAGIVLKVVGFLLICFTVGLWCARRATNFVQDYFAAPDRALTFVIVCVFLVGAAAQTLGFEAILGAFVTGVIFGQVRHLPIQVHHQLQSISAAIFSPIFFAVAGLKVDLRILADPQIFFGAALIVAVATAAKFTGTFLGARLIGRKGFWYSLCFGAGLNARGAMEILVATIGLNAGIISVQMFSVIVVLAISTSVISPPLLRLFVRRIPADAAELGRLEGEALRGANLIAGMRRMLVPVRVRAEGPGPANRVEALLMGRLAGEHRIGVTVLNVQSSAESGRRAANEFLRALVPLFAPARVVTRMVVSGQPAEAILEEARRGYDLIVLGAPEQREASSVIFAPLIDYLVRFSTVPTLIVRGADVRPNWEPRRILVPTNGAAVARHAAALAFQIATPLDRVFVLNVVEQRASLVPPAHSSAYEDRLRIAEDITGALVRLGEQAGIPAEFAVESAPSPEEGILDFATRNAMDLIVLGTDLRPDSERLYLGPRVEAILEAASCPVVIFNVP